MLSRWQVFGLASSPNGSYCPRFPTGVSAFVEVVLAYRCGAVPDLHRIPSSAPRQKSPSTSVNYGTSLSRKLPPVATPPL